MPISEGTAALVGAGVAAAGATASAAGAFTSAYRAYKWNKKLAEWQNEQNLANWNLANEYNTPSAQYDRLRQAGLNPLYYGLDGNSTNAFEAASAAPYVSPSIQNPFEGMQNLGIQLAQIENLQANTAKTNNENLTETKRRENLEQELKNLRLTADEILSRTDLNKEERRIAEKNREWIDRLNQANLEYTESQKKFNDTQINRIEQLLENEKVIQAKTIEEFDYRFNAMIAAAAKDRALAGLTRKDIENYSLIHMDSGFMGTGLSLRNLILSALGFSEYVEENSDGSKPVYDVPVGGGSR